MDTKKILKKINNYNHLITLYLEAESQLERLEATAPEAYAALRDDIGRITLEDAIGELCMIAGVEEMEVVEMLTPTAPDATVEKMEQRWYDLWTIYDAAQKAHPFFGEGLEAVENCIETQRDIIIKAGFADKIDVLV